MPTKNLFLPVWIAVWHGSLRINVRESKTSRRAHGFPSVWKKNLEWNWKPLAWNKSDFRIESIFGEWRAGWDENFFFWCVIPCVWPACRQCTALATFTQESMHICAITITAACGPIEGEGRNLQTVYRSHFLHDFPLLVNTPLGMCKPCLYIQTIYLFISFPLIWLSVLHFLSV